jgi:hypothetical protein
MTKSSGPDSRNTLYCSFCGKSQHEVRKLIAGPTVFICDECVELCMDIVLGEQVPRYHKIADEARREVWARDRRALNMLPSSWLPASNAIGEWPKGERLRLRQRWASLCGHFQPVLIESCPPDMEMAQYIGEYLTQQEACRLFEQACHRAGISLKDGIKMIFDSIMEEIAPPFDRVIKLLRLAREDQPEIPL